MVLWMISACSTRLNPEFCRSNAECADGFVCDLARNRCDAIDAVPDAAAVSDATNDARRCSPTADFEEPTLVGGINSSLDEMSLTLTRDELTAFVVRYSQSTQTLLMATRNSRNDLFDIVSTAPELADLMAEEGLEYDPGVAADGLTLYFHRSTMTSAGLFVATRATSADRFSKGTTPITVDGQVQDDSMPRISNDGDTFYWFEYAGQTPFRPHSATRTTTAGTFTNARAATTFRTGSFAISSDELTLYYSDEAGNDIFRTTRASRTVPFQNGVPLGAVNSAQQDMPLFVSSDDCSLYLASRRTGGAGGLDIWMAQRPAP